jgi:Protein of unknown function (DUF1569)
MKSLFDTETYEEISTRMQKLGPATQRQWGKMDVAQMLAHCKAAFSVPLSEKKMPRNILGLLVGWAVKKKLYNEDPWKRNLPTAPNFIIKDKREFEKEKQELMLLIDRFYTLGPGKVGLFPHPMFGSYTSEQWGKSMYKHLDHHLRQFGA